MPEEDIEREVDLLLRFVKLENEVISSQMNYRWYAKNALL